MYCLFLVRTYPQVVSLPSKPVLFRVSSSIPYLWLPLQPLFLVALATVLCCQVLRLLSRLFIDITDVQSPLVSSNYLAHFTYRTLRPCTSVHVCPTFLSVFNRCLQRISDQHHNSSLMLPLQYGHAVSTIMSITSHHLFIDKFFINKHISCPSNLHLIVMLFSSHVRSQTLFYFLIF